jgi:hypothetical protein
VSGCDEKREKIFLISSMLTLKGGFRWSKSLASAGIHGVMIWT